MSPHIGDDDAKSIVQRGYDVISERYLEWSTGFVTPRGRYEEKLFELVPDGSHVLDLGCGNGTRGTRRLAEHYQVVGVDLSPRAIELARRELPDVELLCADMTDLELGAESFDAVTAFYSLIHVPRQKQSTVLGNIARWLRAGGVLLATMTVEDLPEGYEADWLGAPMYWSGFDADANRRLVRDAGFEIITDEIAGNVEHGEQVDFLWIVARRR